MEVMVHIYILVVWVNK